MLKRTLVMLLAGLGLGLALAMWLGPLYIGWDNEPRFATQYSCDAPIKSALHWLVMSELVVGGSFAVLTAIVGNVVAARRRRKLAVAKPQPVSPAGGS